MMQLLIEANHYFNTEVSNYFESISEGDWLAVATLLAFSFAYGVVHALGPGHGKALLSGYLLANQKTSTSHIFRIGFFIALVHAFSALVLSLAATYVIQVSATKLLRDITLPVTQISGILIVLMGCWILFEVIRSRMQEEEIDTNKELSVIILSGIVPCPGVMTLSLFAMTLGELGIGIFAALCMSLGMGLTISLVGFVTSRLKTISTIKTQSLWFWLLRIFGAIIVIVIGIILIGFTSNRPF